MAASADGACGMNDDSWNEIGLHLDQVVKDLEEKERQRLLGHAMHEAGHAVVFEHFRIAVKYIALEETVVILHGETFTILGRCVPVDPRAITKENFPQEVTCLIAGYESERRIIGDAAIEGVKCDVQDALKHVGEAGLTEEEALAQVTEARAIVEKLVTDNFEIIRKIADQLVAERRLEGEKIREIIRAAGSK